MSFVQYFRKKHQIKKERSYPYILFFSFHLYIYLNINKISTVLRCPPLFNNVLNPSNKKHTSWYIWVLTNAVPESRSISKTEYLLCLNISFNKEPLFIAWCTVKNWGNCFVKHPKKFPYTLISSVILFLFFTKMIYIIDNPKCDIIKC